MGALMGAGIGGLSGGLESLANGGSFWEGFEDEAFSGAISGAVMGGAMAGLGQLGATLGHGIKCASALGKTIKVTAAVTKTISTVMGGFDTLAMMDKTFGIFGGNLADFNSQLHESALYNTFQIGVTALAVFTNGMTSTMSCFVAGTLVLTACGLVAIENIKAGDKVIAQNIETGEQTVKAVVETYVRQVTELVHLRIGGEQITTTHDHPFFVIGKGFVNAGKLRTCDTLLDSNQNRLTIDDISFETSEEPTTVYNFQVEEVHTYYVGENCILVHNAKYDVGKYNEMPNEPGMDKHHVPQKAVMKKLDPNYDPATGPSIQVPKEGHTIKGPRGIVSRSSKGINSPSELIMRDISELIMRDISELKRVYPDIPQSSINELISMLKGMGY